MKIHSRVLYVIRYFLRHRSKLSKFRQDALYGDEIVRNEYLFRKPPERNNSDSLPIKANDELRQNIHYPELSVDDVNFRNALAAARGISEPTSVPGNRTIVLEGSRLIRDALQSGGQPLYLLFSSRDVLQEVMGQADVSNIYYVPHRTLKKWSQLKNPPGILAIVRIPDTTNDSKANVIPSIWKPLPTTLIIDGIRDPGNLGSLLRTAAGFGLPRVFVLKGSVDIWNEKVVRAGMSAHFRVPIYSGLNWSAIARHFVPTELNSPDVDKGYSPRVFVADIAKKLDDRSILDTTLLTEESSTDASDEYHSDQELDSSKKPILLDGSRGAYYLPLSLSPHFAIDYFPTSSVELTHGTRKPTVALIVGGEANGVSPEAYHLAHLTSGARIYVPSSPETESLNVLSATSAILGEMQRQYIRSTNTIHISQ